jgi:hypothetical protein
VEKLVSELQFKKLQVIMMLGSPTFEKASKSEGDYFLAKNKLGISLLVTFRTRKILKARLNHIRFNKLQLLNLILSAVIPNVLSIMIETTERMPDAITSISRNSLTKTWFSILIKFSLRSP